MDGTLIRQWVAQSLPLLRKLSLAENPTYKSLPLMHAD